MEIEEAKKVLNLEEPYNIREIILSYQSQGFNEIETEAKNILIKQNIIENLKMDLREIILPGDICYNCNGMGMLYNFYFKTSIVPCPDCNGTGLFTIKCNKCQNGEIVYRRGNKVIVTKCRSCEGTGIHSKKRCRRCLGTGKIKHYDRIKIKSSRKCPSCKGTGFHTFKKFRNSVLNAGQAIKIRY